MDYCWVSGQGIVVSLSSSLKSSLLLYNKINIISIDGNKLQSIDINDLTYKADNDDEYELNKDSYNHSNNANIIGLAFSQLSYHLITITAYLNSNVTTYRIHIFGCNHSASSSPSIPKWTLIKTINPDIIGIDLADLGLGLSTGTFQDDYYYYYHYNH